MKTITDKELFEIRKAGGNVKRGEAPETNKDKKQYPGIEQSLDSLNNYVKQIVTKKDNTRIIMQSAETISKSVEVVSGILSEAIGKINSLQNNEKIKAWDVTVERGSDKLIKTLTMRAKQI